MKGKLKGFHGRRALFPAAYYAANSVHQGYMSLFYTRLGFGSGRLGEINAATAATALLVQPVWGMLADRSKRQRRLLSVVCLLAAASLPLALVHTGFAAQLVAATAFYAFFCALLPMGDTILLSEQDGHFGAYRLAGGASFALTGMIFGLVRGRMGENSAVWTAAGLLLLTALATRGLPETSGKQKRARTSFLPLLRNRPLIGMLLFVFPLQMTMGSFYTFYAPYFKNLSGGTDALLGVSYLISAASEAPYLLMSGHVYGRFGAVKPMCLAALMLSFRWLTLALAHSAGAALASQALHGGGFIVISVSMAYWIAENVPAELRASGQMLLNMLAFGAARFAGNLVGGLLAQTWGAEGMFLINAGLCFAATLIFLPHAFAKPK